MEPLIPTSSASHRWASCQVPRSFWEGGIITLKYSGHQWSSVVNAGCTVACGSMFSMQWEETTHVQPQVRYSKVLLHLPHQRQNEKRIMCFFINALFNLRLGEGNPQSPVTVWDSDNDEAQLHTSCSQPAAWNITPTQQNLIEFGGQCRRSPIPFQRRRVSQIASFQLWSPGLPKQKSIDCSRLILSHRHIWLLAHLCTSSFAHMIGICSCQLGNR